MRFNSVFTGVANNRFIVGFGITIVTFLILIIASSFKKHTDRDLRTKQVNLIIRQIGHRLLLQSGDSTSRVLPVTEIREGTFVLTFEKELVFSHDSLMLLSQGLLPKTLFPSGYTVTVHDCKKTNIVYGFQLNNSSPDILACNGRSEPPGCYTIEFTFPDFYQNVKQKKADSDQVTGSGKDSQESVATLEGFEDKTFDYNIDHLTEPTKVGVQQINQSTEKSKKKRSEFPIKNVVFGGVLALLCVGLLIVRFKKIEKPLPVQNNDQTIIPNSVFELPALGKFLFDTKVQRLLLGSEVIPLTDKESKVLELLHQNFGELIPRDTLMQEVWINEGVITGRSLDMFISKLRKKLSADPELRITNIHGKGYRLEIVNDVIA